jgi:hypothetical protein
MFKLPILYNTDHRWIVQKLLQIKMGFQSASTRPTRSLILQETQPAAPASLVIRHNVHPVPSLVNREHKPTSSMIVQEDIRSSSSSILSTFRGKLRWPSRKSMRGLPGTYNDSGVGSDVVERAIQITMERLYGDYYGDNDDSEPDHARYFESYMLLRWRTVPIMTDEDCDDPVVRYSVPRELDYRQIHFERISFPDFEKAILKHTFLIHGLDQARKTRFVIKCHSNNNSGDSSIIRPGSGSFELTVMPTDSEIYVLAALKISLSQGVLALARVSLESSHYLLWLNMRNYVDSLTFRLHDQLHVNVGELAVSATPMTDQRGMCFESLHEFLRDDLLQNAVAKRYSQSYDPPSEMKLFHGGPLLSNLH